MVRFAFWLWVPSRVLCVGTLLQARTYTSAPRRQTRSLRIKACRGWRVPRLARAAVGACARMAVRNSSLKAAMDARRKSREASETAPAAPPPKKTRHEPTPRMPFLFLLCLPLFFIWPFRVWA